MELNRKRTGIALTLLFCEKVLLKSQAKGRKYWIHQVFKFGSRDLLPVLKMNISDHALETAMQKKEHYNVSLENESTEPQTETDLLHINCSVILGVLVGIVAIGIIVNILVIYVINLDKSLHRAPYYYLLCMSVMDLFKSIFCLPFMIEVVLHDFQWEYGDHTCIALAFETAFYTTATTTGIVAIAIDRYLSFTASRFYNKYLNDYWARIAIAVGCGVAFCLSFPPVFENKTYRFIPLEMQCTIYHMPYRDNRTLGYTFTFICMLLLTMFFYLRSFLFMRSHRRMAPINYQPARSNDWAFFGPGNNTQAVANLLNGFAVGTPNAAVVNNFNMQHRIGRFSLQVVKNRHETRLFFVISVSYIVLWISYLFQTFVKVFNSGIHLPPVFIVISTVLSSSHVAVTPLICVFLGSPIRSALVWKIKNILNNQTYSGVATNEEIENDVNLPHTDLSL